MVEPMVPKDWSVFLGDSDAPGPQDSVVREFDLIDGGGDGMAPKRKRNLTKPSEREWVEKLHAAELARLEAVYQTSLASMDSRHAAELARLLGIIDKLIAKVGTVE